jgi:hypothetical protein
MTHWWWGYEDAIGNIYAERYVDERSLADARARDDVMVIEPFECESREEALRVVKKEIEHLYT